MKKLLTALALFCAPLCFAADAQPVAYIPNALPLTRTNPQITDAAREAQASSEVRMLVTIDPQGKSIATEFLEGSPLLESVAAEAVKSWTFRPVLREGKPVVAYTDVSVHFVDKAGTIRYHSDPAQSRAAYQRLQDLIQKFPRTRTVELADLEQQSGSNEAGTVDALERRSFYLKYLGKTALEAGDPDRAAAYAKELLTNPGYSLDESTHDANIILGIVAMGRGDIEEAKRDLLKAGHVKGSPALKSFGPNMLLAQKLLEKHEDATVLEYFSLCRTFWERGGTKLDAWTETVKSGQTPSFGPNLRY